MAQSSGRGFFVENERSRVRREGAGLGVFLRRPTTFGASKFARTLEE